MGYQPVDGGTPPVAGRVQHLVVRRPARRMTSGKAVPMPSACREPTALERQRVERSTRIRGPRPTPLFWTPGSMYLRFVGPPLGVVSLARTGSSVDA